MYGALYGDKAALFNLRLDQLGFGNLNQLVHALIEGRFDNRKLIDGMVNAIAEGVD